MSRSNREQIAERVRQCDAQVILKAAALCDGHSILKPEALTDAGLPQEVVEHLTRTYRSDGTPKGTIFVHGQPVSDLSGVYGLDALRLFANALGVEYQRSLGRGSEAANIRQALFRRLSPQTSL